MAPLAERISLLHISPIRKVAALLDEARGKEDLISFGGGAPSIPPPRELLDEMKRLMDEQPLLSFTYTGTRGIPALRRQIAEDTERSCGLAYDPDSEVIVTNGATEALYVLLMALIEEGDEVIIMDPTYLGYKELIRLAGGVPISLPVSVDQGYQPSDELLKELISRKTKAVIILSPDNPTGRLITKSFARAVVDLAADRGFMVISDDIYRHVVYEGEHVWLCSLPGAFEHVITVGSFSKEFGMPGLRLGFALAPSYVIDAMEKVKQYTSLASNSLGQFALVRLLRESIREKYMGQAMAVYRRRRDAMGEAIAEYLPEARTTRPAGAFFYFVDMGGYLSRMGMDDEAFCTALIKEKGVIAIPGSYFGDMGKQHVRLTFVSETQDRIHQGLRLMGEFVSKR